MSKATHGATPWRSPRRRAQAHGAVGAHKRLGANGDLCSMKRAGWREVQRALLALGCAIAWAAVAAAGLAAVGLW